MKPVLTIRFSFFIRLAILLVVVAAICIFAFFPYSVEKIYSDKCYPAIAATLRMITKWVPFSVGDVLYIILFIWLVVKTATLILRIRRREFTRMYLLYFLLKLLSIILWIYIIFKLMWGLNYDRLGIAYQLRIEKNTYTKEEVTILTNQLIDKVNACRRQIADTGLPIRPVDTIFREAYRAYQRASSNHDFLNYTNRSVKRSLFTPISDYLGFTGYYNPFTGEAQLRSDIPSILIPYVACHEMAHQLGYASESEANFVGYLAASESKDVYMNYSVYLDLFSYAQAEEITLYGREKDFKAFQEMLMNNRNRLDTLVKKDRRAIRAFFNQRKNSISPAVSNLYDQYLKMNKQFTGVNSYNEVIGWLIAYQKNMEKSKALKLAAALLLTVGVGSLGGFFTSSEIAGWYTTLQKPSFNPPNWLFAPVWTLLYIMMGIAVYLVWKKPASDARNAALRVFMLQFLLNFLLVADFFRLHQVASALFEIVLMWLLILMTIFRFRKESVTAAWLLVPYLLWVSFATVLNAAIWKLNFS